MATVSYALEQKYAYSSIDGYVTALIIEDSKLDQIVLKKILVNDGFNTVVASDGEEAVSTFSKHQPDIVFMDLNLPDINGYDLTEIIKK